MRDIQRTLSELGRAAEQAAAPVGFEGIRQRARRRRRAQTFSAAVLCAAVAAGVGLGIDQATAPGRTLGPAHHRSPHLSPTTAPTHHKPPPRHRLTARQIVEDPRSSVLESTVFPRDVNQAAALWMLGAAGPRAQVALTTTVDGYQHVRYVPLPARDEGDCTGIRALGNHEFWLSCSLHDILVTADQVISLPHGAAGGRPVPNDAVLVSGPSLSGKGAAWSWIDSHGVMHPLDVPVPGPTWLVHAPDGRIWGLDYWAADRAKLIWSTDGGRTWTARPLPPVPPGGSATYELIPTAVPGQMVVARGVAETVFVPHSILMFGSTGQQLQEVHLDTGHASMDSAVVTSDGGLVMELYNEPDGDSGLFRGAPGHWTELQKVMGLPTDAAGLPAAALWMGSSRDPSGRPLVWAVFRSGVLATSTDDGQTWTTRSIR